MPQFEIHPDPNWGIKYPPKILYVEGSKKALGLLADLPERGLSVVGTRNPTPRSIQFLRQCILELRGTPLVIISGFARGVDGSAHQAALEAGLPTIAILGSGLDVCYPYEHQELKTKILAQDGLLISELPLGTKILPYQFLRRNRLIAGLSKATWVVEAPEKSGALNTAEWAKESGRTCYVTPCYPHDTCLAGNQKLLDDGFATAVWGIHSFGSTWLELATHKSSSLRILELSSDEKKVMSKIDALLTLFGGAQIEDLLDWALSVHWSSQKFFALLESLAKRGYLIEHKGLLLKNRSVCD